MKLIKMMKMTNALVDFVGVLVDYPNDVYHLYAFCKFERVYSLIYMGNTITGSLDAAFELSKKNAMNVEFNSIEFNSDSFPDEFLFWYRKEIVVIE